MNRHLELLIELSKIDKEIDSFGPKEQEINKNVLQLQQELQSNQVVIEEIEESIKDTKQSKLKNEAHLQELQDKLKNIEKKNSTIKTEKELKSLQIEEGIAKEQIGFINEEIVRLDKIEAEKEAEIKELKAKNKELEVKIQEAMKATDKELSNLQKKKQESFDKKEKLLTQIPQKVLTFYQKIRRWAGNTTVVPVRKQACYGCHMKIGDRIYAEVIKSEEIVTCPSCGRILYIEQEEEKE